MYGEDSILHFDDNKIKADVFRLKVISIFLVLRGWLR